MRAMKPNQLKMLLASCRFLVLAIVLLGLPVLRAGAQANSLYENDAVVTDPVPIPDATNFLNTGTFTIDFPEGELYQTHDTLNYTNTGYMHNTAYGFDF